MNEMYRKLEKLSVQYELGELINELKRYPTDRVLKWGLVKPHSHRGDYRTIAFELAENISIADMLHVANTSIGAVYEGWKGGDYLMQEWTNVYIAERGDSGIPLTRWVLDMLLEEVA